MKGEVEKQDFLGKEKGGNLGQCVERIAVKDIKILTNSIAINIVSEIIQHC